MIKNSTQLIAASEADFKMLKENGKEGEWALHYHGYLDGYAQGVMDARNGWHKVADEFPEEYNYVVGCVQGGEDASLIMLDYLLPNGKWGLHNENKYTHWMPIPEITED